MILDTDTRTPLNEPRDGLPEITHDDYESAVERLRNGHGPFAVDTERAMGIRYSNRAYLVQIKRAGSGIVLLDQSVSKIASGTLPRSCMTNGSSMLQIKISPACANLA